MKDIEDICSDFYACGFMSYRHTLMFVVSRHCLFSIGTLHPTFQSLCTAFLGAVQIGVPTGGVPLEELRDFHESGLQLRRQPVEPL